VGLLFAETTASFCRYPFTCCCECLYQQKVCRRLRVVRFGVLVWTSDWATELCVPRCVDPRIGRVGSFVIELVIYLFQLAVWLPWGVKRQTAAVVLTIRVTAGLEKALVGTGF